MRALTLTQPWAGLVASGIKLVENRPRPVIKATSMGTRFAIHASREIDESIYDRIKEIDPSLFTQRGYACWYRYSRITSAVIAVATVKAKFEMTSVQDAQDRIDLMFGSNDQGRWAFGPICYLLSNIVALADAVPCKGSLGFWSLPADVERDVIRQRGTS